MDENTFRRYLCVCLETRPRRVDGIEIFALPNVSGKSVGVSVRIVSLKNPS